MTDTASSEEVPTEAEDFESFPGNVPPDTGNMNAVQKEKE